LLLLLLDFALMGLSALASSNDVVGVLSESKICCGLSSSSSSSPTLGCLGPADGRFAASPGRPRNTDAADPLCCCCLEEDEEEDAGPPGPLDEGGGGPSIFGTWIGVVPPMTRLVVPVPPPPRWLLDEWDPPPSPRAEGWWLYR